MVRETVAPGAQARWQVIGPEFPEREQQPVGEVFGQPAQPRERRVDPALEREEARPPCGAESSDRNEPVLAVQTGGIERIEVDIFARVRTRRHDGPGRRGWVSPFWGGCT